MITEHELPFKKKKKLFLTFTSKLIYLDTSDTKSIEEPLKSLRPTQWGHSQDQVGCVSSLFAPQFFNCEVFAFFKVSRHAVNDLLYVLAQPSRAGLVRRLHTPPVCWG